MPTSGSSLHLPFIQINWPVQSFRVRHGPLQEEIAPERLGREITETKRETSKAKFAIGTKGLVFPSDVNKSDPLLGLL